MITAQDFYIAPNLETERYNYDPVRIIDSPEKDSNVGGGVILPSSYDDGDFVNYDTAAADRDNYEENYSRIVEQIKRRKTKKKAKRRKHKLVTPATGQGHNPWKDGGGGYDDVFGKPNPELTEKLFNIDHGDANRFHDENLQEKKIPGSRVFGGVLDSQSLEERGKKIMEKHKTTSTGNDHTFDELENDRFRNHLIDSLSRFRPELLDPTHIGIDSDMYPYSEEDFSINPRIKAILSDSPDSPIDAIEQMLDMVKEKEPRQHHQEEVYDYDWKKIENGAEDLEQDYYEWVEDKKEATTTKVPDWNKSHIFSDSEKDRSFQRKAKEQETDVGIQDLEDSKSDNLGLFSSSVNTRAHM
jgi:hypothetical protein